MIRVEGLTKVYDQFTAVNGIDLHVREGEIYGFLGPNGAGKTTSIRMMIGLLKPTSGRIVLGGKDLEADPIGAKQIVGFVPDRPYIYEKLTAREFLEFMGGVYGVDKETVAKRGAELLEFFDLTNWTDELIESYSHGMKQRLTMASAFLHSPKIFIVDEPMVGLDPKGARLFKDALREMSARGTTIFMSSHSLAVVEELCTRVSIIQGGNIIATGSIDELRERAADPSGNLEHVFLKLTGEADAAVPEEIAGG
ncbi:MAG: ABC transporter ATP-binding protein [Chrysiogenetes bacterium]|nr:ABC transporter ATP-binding protein [Chrysiogenetes bacterium]